MSFYSFWAKKPHINGCKIVHILHILLSLSLLPDFLFVSALTSPHSPFSSFALTLTIAIGQTMPLLPPIIKTSLSPLSLFLSFITFSSILFVDVGILRFWLDLTEEHGVVFIGVDFSKSWRRLWSIFTAAVEEDQPSEPTKAMRQWTRWWTSASSKLKS